MTREESQAELEAQAQVRAQLGHDWKAQRRGHFKVLHIDGPVNVRAKAIINRALLKEGFAPRRRS